MQNRQSIHKQLKPSSIPSLVAFFASGIEVNTVRLSNAPQPRVLLIHRNSTKPQLRTTVSGNCEISVVVANGTEEAQRLCRENRYDMVLLSSEHGFAEALGFCEELRKVVPKQWVALLAVRRETYKKWQPCE